MWAQSLQKLVQFACRCRIGGEGLGRGVTRRCGLHERLGKAHCSLGMKTGSVSNWGCEGDTWNTYVCLWKNMWGWCDRSMGWCLRPADGLHGYLRGRCMSCHRGINVCEVCRLWTYTDGYVWCVLRRRGWKWWCGSLWWRCDRGVELGMNYGRRICGSWWTTVENGIRSRILKWTDYHLQLRKAKDKRNDTQTKIYITYISFKLCKIIIYN